MIGLKSRLFVNELNLKIDVVLKASRAGHQVIFFKLGTFGEIYFQLFALFWKK